MYASGDSKSKEVGGDSLPSGERLVSTLFLTSANESSVNANFSFASSKELLLSVLQRSCLDCCLLYRTSLVLC